ncbi:MAG: HAD family hydrolase [Bacteroidia bacterium]|nr:HAD family hydrolase [Bacteroidia bacterium]
MENLKVIAFDADDTLWVNEPHFQELEKKFCDMLEDYLPHHSVSRELLQIEIQNIGYYGYGVKSFMLSMIETAIRISDGTIGIAAIEKIIRYGKEMLDKEVENLDGVEEVLQQLQGKFRLVMATKGDLLDQERKLIKSGLGKYFHHIEIVSEKKEKEYQKLIRHLDIAPAEFLMIGNSLKSDILPVLNIGGYGFHVPFHTTWELEKVEINIEHPHFRELANIRETLQYLSL